jgi:WhiB family redox-sensing transcriptional regulator
MYVANLWGIPVKEQLFPRGRAACTGHNTEMWFPDYTVNKDSHTKRELVAKRNKDIAAAKAICETCEIKQECLMWSLKYEPFGIWGGRDERERFWDRRDYKVECVINERLFIPGLGRVSTATVKTETRVIGRMK